MIQNFTNNELVAFCEKFIGNPYWYGCCVYKCTDSLYTRKKKQYPSHYTTAREAEYKKHISGKKVCADCIGLN